MRIFRYSVLVLTVHLSFSVTAYTQTMTTIIDSKIPGPVELIPVDAAHKAALPASLVSVYDRIPPGSVLVVNKSSKAIITVVAEWSFDSSVPGTGKARMNCDGFMAAPPEEIVHPHSMSLITPNGCTAEEVFAKLSSPALFGSSLEVRGKAAKTRAATDQIHVSIDLLIFSDGELRGENRHEFNHVIEERFDSIRSVAEQVAVEHSHEGRKARIATLRSQIESQRDSPSIHTKQYLKILDKSPNMEGTLRYLQSFTAPPRFYRQKENNQ